MSAWRPLVAGARRDALVDAVEELAAGMGARLDSIDEPSLGRGDAGLATCFTYLAATLPGRDYEATADRLLTRAVERLADRPIGPGLYAGYAGVALAHELVAPLLYDVPQPEDALDEIDDTLLDALDVDVSHELLDGLAGFGVYALCRGPRPVARRILERILERLESRAKHTADGLTWVTTPAMAAYRGGTTAAYDLGVAHGVPGVIALLAAFVEADVQAARAQRLLDGSLRWLFARVHADGPAGLDAFSTPTFGGGARLAWCYGDLGVAAALSWATEVHGDRGFVEAAQALGRRAARRDFESSGVVDAALCHGAAGNAHAFNRLWQRTDDALFAEAALRWLDRALAYASSDGTLGFLEGMAGIALACAAAISDQEPRWDRLLLLSSPIEPRSEA